MYFAETSTPAAKPKHDLGIRKPFTLPDRKDNEELIDYVTALQNNAPFEYCTVGGINFEKKVLPADHSYADKQEEQVRYGVLVRKLTERQATALQKRANEVKKEIPRKANRKWNPKDPDSKEYLDGWMTTLGKWIVLCPKKGYNPMEDYQPEMPREAEEEEEEGDLGEALIKAQGKKGRK